MSDQPGTPIYPDEVAGRRFSGFLRRWALIGVLVIVVATGLALAVSHEMAERQALDDELVFAALVSVVPVERVGPLVEASGREAQVFDGSVLVALHVPEGASMDQRFGRWRARVRNRASTTSGYHFASVDPDGDAWSHTTVDFGESARLVTSRPESDVLAPWRELVPVIVGLGLAALAGLAAVFAVAYRRIGRPVIVLAEAGADLRVRGEIRGEARRELDRIVDTPHELRQLVDTFIELEAEGRQEHRWVEALLNAAAGLGASLDQQTVLDRTLEHLEDLLGVERSAILRYEPRVEAFEVVAVRGHDHAYLADMTARGHDPTLPSVRALRERVPIQVSDTEARVVSPELRARGRRHGYRSILAIPLTDELDHPTALLLHGMSPRTYSYDEVELSKSFAWIAGAAVRNAELFGSTDSRLRLQTSRLEAIMGSVDQGLLVESGDGRVLFANPAMRSLLPSSEPFVEGMETVRFVDAVLSTGHNPTANRAELDRLDPSGSTHCDVSLQGPPGESPVIYRVRRFAVRDAKGQDMGRGQTWLDVSRDRELERMKAGLLAAVSHEFRTPLTLIKGYASTLLADDVSWNPADQREFLQLVSAEADRLASLVQRILDMRRIDAGMVSLQPMAVGLAVVVDSAVGALPHEADRIQIEPLPPVTVEIDAARIVTVLRNLIENGCKYSPPEMPVVVSAMVEAGSDDDGVTVAISVRDHGRGISPRMRDRVFETFVRADPGLDAEHGGIGLGLAIAKGFVEAHGGRIWIDDPPGGTSGTVLTFTLPATQPVTAPATVTGPESSTARGSGVGSTS